MRDTKSRVSGDQALELTMRDVLDGLEELATIAGLNSAAGCMEGVEIVRKPSGGKLLHFPQRAAGRLMHHQPGH